MTNWLGGGYSEEQRLEGEEKQGWVGCSSCSRSRAEKQSRRKQNVDEVSLLLSTTLEHWQRAVGLQPRAKLERGAWLVPSGGFIVRSGPALMMVVQGAISGKWMGHKGRRGLERTPLGI